MDARLIHIIWTVLLMAIFIGIVAWAWSGRNKKRFDAAARVAMEDDVVPPPSRGRLGGGWGDSVDAQSDPIPTPNPPLEGEGAQRKRR